MASTAHTWNSLKFTINSFLVWPSFILSFYATCNILLKSEVFSSVIQSYPTLFDSMDCSTPGLSVHHQLKLMSIESVMPSNHLFLCHPLLLLPSIFPSIRVFASESALCIRWPKYWSFSFNISPSNEHLGLISFRMDWLDPKKGSPALKVHAVCAGPCLSARLVWCCRRITASTSSCFFYCPSASSCREHPSQPARLSNLLAPRGSDEAAPIRGVSP